MLGLSTTAFWSAATGAAISTTRRPTENGQRSKSTIQGGCSTRTPARGLEGDPDEDPEDVESTLISDYIATYGSRPFANPKVGKAIQTGG